MKKYTKKEFVILDKTIRNIEKWEGLELEAYRCIAGVWTIGYGSTMIDGKQVKKGMKITREKADDLMRKELRAIGQIIYKNLKVPINVNQYNALVSLAYNIGTGALLSSSVMKYLNKGNIKKAANAILLYNKYTNPKNGKKEFNQSLYDRRVVEKEWFLDPILPNIDIKKDVPIVKIEPVLTVNADKLNPTLFKNYKRKVELVDYFFDTDAVVDIKLPWHLNLLFTIKHIF